MAGNTKVLVIDDDPDTLDAMRLLLEGRSFDVVTATGPEEGMLRLEQERPDAVVLDIMMPHGTEGFHWVWKVRRHTDESLRGIPIIVVSSIHSTTSFRFGKGDADESGDYLPVQGFFDKPADPDRLAEKIRAVLSSGS